ncbi:hypothetical protein V8D89_011202 [Ganoderma adspersum]
MHAQIGDDLQILGDLLAWNILDGARHEMRVFNWKTGITVWFPPPPGPHDRPLYQHDPDLTVLTVYLEFRVTTPRRVVQHDQYAIFIPVSTLKAQIEMPVVPPLPPGAGAPPRAVEWDQWGPAGTRLVHLEFPCTISPFGCSVALAQKKWAGPNVSLKVFVFDVHPWARPQGQGPPGAQDSDAGARGLVYATDTLLETPAFARRIRTTFPCEFTLRDIPLGMDELSARLVLTEDGLVLVTPAASA